MASYGTIYEFRFDDINGADVDIFIAKKNYTGSVTRRALGRAPILKRERSGNILGTSLEIYAECKVDGEFAQLYTSSADEFRVEVYKRQNMLWRGFISPELYSEPDIAPPYDVQIIATDGLGELKNHDYGFLGKVSLREHFQHALAATSLPSDITLISSLLWDDNASEKDTDSLFDLVTDLSHMAEESCYDVLQNILASLNACITQQDGSWMVIRESDLYLNTLKLPPAAFGSMDKTHWWPIGNLSSDIIPAKKKLTLIQENEYKKNLLTPIYTGVAGGWDLTSGVYYDEVEKGYIIPSSEDSISYSIDFHSNPLKTQLRLTFRARCLSRGDRQDDSKMSLTIMMSGSINGTSGVYHLSPDYFSDNDRTQMKWFGGDKLGFIRSWDPPKAPEGEPDIQDIEVSIPLYHTSVEKYAVANQLTLEISNAPNSPYRLCVYDVILAAEQQYPGVKIIANLANDAREEAPETDLIMATNPDPMLEATMYGQLRGNGGITRLYTPANTASDLLRFLVRDYAMQVALPRMRYRGKINVPNFAFPRIPVLFQRDNTYYFLNTYSYDLLNSELEVELISIPNAQVQIESETVTELPSSGSGSASSSGGSSGGGGSTGGSGVLDIVVDSVMSDTSTNPVQNKVVKQYVDDAETKAKKYTDDKISQIEVGSGISQENADKRYIRKVVDNFDSDLTFAVADGIVGTDDEYYFIPAKAPSTASDSQILATKADVNKGGGDIDPSNFATKDELNNLTNEVIANEEVHAAALNDLNERKADKDDIPTKVSQLTNDSNFQTETEVFGTVLYNVDVANTNYGAVTLSDSTANYEFVDFYAATNDKHVFFNRVYQPNGKKIAFTGVLVDNTSLFLKAKVYECNGNKLTTAKGTNDLVWAGEWGSEKNSLERRENTVGIWRVVGYKR